MDYQTFQPDAELDAIISCYWTLEVPASDDHQKQRIVPDGTIEMAFILGDDIKRYVSDDEFIIQPRAMVLGQITTPFFIEPLGYGAMVLGQITTPFFIEPLGYVNTFAIRFYPHSFASLTSTPIKNLVNTETPLAELFGEKTADDLTQAIVQAKDTSSRIAVAEAFLKSKLNEQQVVDNIIQTTIDALIASSGNTPIAAITKQDLAQRRRLERKFQQQVGLSPKQLGKVIRLQQALTMLLNNKDDKLMDIAYARKYYDQAHFIRDFKEFTGVSPKEFLGHKHMELSSLFYQ